MRQDLHASWSYAWRHVVRNTVIPAVFFTLAYYAMTFMLYVERPLG